MSLPVITQPAEPNSYWTEEECQIIRELYGSMPNEELAEYLPGRSVAAVQSRARVMGLQKSVMVIDQWRTPEGLAKIKQMLADGETQIGVARHIGIDHSSFSRWVSAYPAIARAVREGKEIAEAGRIQQKLKPRNLIDGHKAKYTGCGGHQNCFWARRIKSGERIPCSFAGCPRDEIDV